MVDLSKHIPIKIIEDEEDEGVVLRGGCDNNKLLTIHPSTIKERIISEINELENQLKYAGEYLQFDKLYEINCKLEVLKKVLVG